MSEGPDWLFRLLLVKDWAGAGLAIFGLAAQAIFMGRMMIQWVVSERARASVVPPSFWWLSLAGSLLLLVYGILRQDIVIIAANMFGFVVYWRNLWFIRLSRQQSGGSC